MVSDSGVPARTAITVVTVNVDRNLHTPRFTQPGELRATVQVKETENFEKVLYTVKATDQDPAVSITTRVLNTVLFSVNFFFLYISFCFHLFFSFSKN